MSYKKVVPDDLMDEYKEWCKTADSKYFDELFNKSYAQVFMDLKNSQWKAGQQRLE